MRILRRSIPLVLLCTLGMANAQSGLRLDKIGGYWSTARPQLQLNAVVLDAGSPWLRGATAGMESAPNTPAASLIGDYYFSKQLTDALVPRSGFRASSALLVRASGVSLSELAWSSRSMTSVAAPSRLQLGYQGAGWSEPTHDVSALPYLGIGYSDYSLKNGWSFWADLGLVVQSPGAVGGLGRTLSGAQGLEEMVRELQLSPMLQFGANYSF